MADDLQEEVRLRQQTFREAWKAAHAAAALKPLEGTPEWHHWQDMVAKALEANKAYLKALADVAHADKSQSRESDSNHR